MSNPFAPPFGPHLVLNDSGDPMEVDLAFWVNTPRPITLETDPIRGRASVETQFLGHGEKPFQTVVRFDDPPPNGLEKEGRFQSANRDEAKGVHAEVVERCHEVLKDDEGPPALSRF